MDKTDKIDMILYAILGVILIVGGFLCKVFIRKRKVYIWFLLCLTSGSILLLLCLCGLLGISGARKE